MLKRLVLSIAKLFPRAHVHAFCFEQSSCKLSHHRLFIDYCVISSLAVMDSQIRVPTTQGGIIRHNASSNFTTTLTEYLLTGNSTTL